MVANSGIEMEPPPSEDFQNQALFGLPVLRPPNFSYPFGLLATAGGSRTASKPGRHSLHLERGSESSPPAPRTDGVARLPDEGRDRDLKPYEDMGCSNSYSRTETGSVGLDEGALCDRSTRHGPSQR